MNDGGFRFRFVRVARCPDEEIIARLDAMCRGIADASDGAALNEQERAYFDALATRVSTWIDRGSERKSYRESAAPQLAVSKSVIDFAFIILVKNVERMMVCEAGVSPTIHDARRLIVAHVAHAAVGLGLGRWVEEGASASDDLSSGSSPGA